MSFQTARGIEARIPHIGDLLTFRHKGVEVQGVIIELWRPLDVVKAMHSDWEAAQFRRLWETRLGLEWQKFWWRAVVKPDWPGEPRFALEPQLVDVDCVDAITVTFDEPTSN
jgi:hypothetical protein